ncbi:hypothetical protein ACFWDG_10145 [Peribacillus sp. NPDC060186]
MLVESPKSAELNHKVSTKAIELLQSSIPSLSIETGKSLIEIAKQDPNWMSTLVAPLLEHEYLWTKLMAYKIILATNNLQISEDVLDTLLKIEPVKEYRLPSLLPSVICIEWNSIIEELIIKILEEE